MGASNPAQQRERNSFNHVQTSSDELRRKVQLNAKLNIRHVIRWWSGGRRPVGRATRPDREHESRGSYEEAGRPCKTSSR